MYRRSRHCVGVPGHAGCHLIFLGRMHGTHGHFVGVPGYAGCHFERTDIARLGSELYNSSMLASDTAFGVPGCADCHSQTARNGSIDIKILYRTSFAQPMVTFTLLPFLSTLEAPSKFIQNQWRTFSTRASEILQHPLSRQSFHRIDILYPLREKVYSKRSTS